MISQHLGGGLGSTGCSSFDAKNLLVSDHLVKSYVKYVG